MSARATAWAWSQIASGRGGSPVSKLVLLRLADRADPEGLCWPGHDRTASDLNVSLKAVKETIRSLEKEGLVTIRRRQDDQGRDLPNLYFLPINPHENDGATRGQILPPGGQKTAQGRGQNLPPNLEDKGEPKRKEREQAQPLSDFQGISFFASNQRDIETVSAIKNFSDREIAQAVSQAQGLDPQARAWPTAVLKVLLVAQAAATKPAPSKPSAPQPPGWARGAVNRPESRRGQGTGRITPGVVIDV